MRVRIDARLLDRIVRGRLWIPLLAVLLVGIVAMRVEVLKLGARVGDATQMASQLESTNQVLRDTVSRLSSDQRIEQLAQSYGMVMPGPMDDHFVRAGASVSKAVRSMTQPQPTTFLTGLRTEQTRNGDTAAAIATGAGLSAAAPAGQNTSSGAAAPTGGASATGTGSPAASASGGSGVAAGASAPASATGGTGTSGVPTGTTGATTAGTTSNTPVGTSSVPASGATASTYGSSSGGASIGG